MNKLHRARPLTKPQLVLLQALPDSPSDGRRCVGGKKVTARKLAAMGLAKCVGVGLMAEHFVRTDLGRKQLNAAVSA